MNVPVDKYVHEFNALNSGKLYIIGILDMYILVLAVLLCLYTLTKHGMYDYTETLQDRLTVSICTTFHLLAHRNLLRDILRLTSSHRAALGLYINLTL